MPRPGDPQSLKRYAYNLNNSIKYTDPTGHDIACAGQDLSNCGSTIPLPAWNEQGQRLSAEEQKRAIAAYLSLVNDPELWAKLFANPKAWDASNLPTDLSLFMWGTALHAWSAESLVYTRMGDAGPGLLEQRAANFEKQYGYRTGFQEVMAKMGPDILGTAGMVWANKPGEVTLSSGRSLNNGMSLSVNDALDAATDFLGPGYQDMGKGRFKSADGLRQVRMGDGDIGVTQPHIYFETLQVDQQTGRMRIVDNLHVYLGE